MADSSAMSTNNQFVKYHISVYENSTNLNSNTSNVTVHVYFYRTNTGYSTYGTGTVYCKINGTTYSAAVTPSQKITSSGIVLFAKTLDIPHGSDGKKTLSTSAWISLNSPLTSDEQGYSYKLTDIPRKSELTVKNGVLGEAQSLTVTQKSTSFTHTVTYKCGEHSGTICEKSKDTKLIFTPGLEFATEAPNGEAVSIAYTIETFNGSTSVGSNTYRAEYSIPESVVPTLSIAVADGALDPAYDVSYEEAYEVYVQNHSQFSVTLTAAGAYGSSIASYETVADGNTYNAAVFVTPVLKNTGVQTITATVIDSRGRKATASVTVTVAECYVPKITDLKAVRCDANGTLNSSGAYLKTTCSADIASVNDLNTAAYKVQYKKTTDSTYTEVSLSDFAGSYVFAADKYSSYDIIFTVTDNFTSVSVSTIGSSVQKFISFLKKGLGIALGKIADTENAFDVNFDSYFRKRVYDRYGTEIQNGVAVYNESADVDPDTSLETAFVTSTNVPTNYYGVSKWYITQIFTSEKSLTAERVQYAVPHKGSSLPLELHVPVYSRHYLEAGGGWSEWYSESLRAWPVNSIYISYGQVSPADLFGGTWERIQEAFLWGCGEEDTIGETGGEKTHTLAKTEVPNAKGNITFHGAGSGGTAVQGTSGICSNGTSVNGYSYQKQTGAWSVGRVDFNLGFGGGAHNNMPPYIKVAIWRRTA